MKCHCLGLHCLPKYMYLFTTSVLPVIQACVYYCILHLKCLNRADNDQTLVYYLFFFSLSCSLS